MSLHILVVDDESARTSSLVNQLERSRHRLRSVASTSAVGAWQAQARARDPFDLVIIVDPCGDRPASAVLAELKRGGDQSPAILLRSEEVPESEQALDDHLGWYASLTLPVNAEEVGRILSDIVMGKPPEEQDPFSGIADESGDSSQIDTPGSGRHQSGSGTHRIRRSVDRNRHIETDVLEHPGEDFDTHDITCSSCSRSFRVLTRKTPYRMNCIHCGVINVVNPG